MNRATLKVLLLIFLVLPLFFLAIPLHSQPIPKDNIILKIKEHAKLHVENDVEMKTELVVELFANNNVGLSRLEIADIYQKEYDRLTQKPKDITGWGCSVYSLHLTGYEKSNRRLVKKSLQNYW